MMKNDRSEKALKTTESPVYILQLDTRDEEWKEDAQKVMKYRLKFMILRHSAQPLHEFSSLFRRFDYFYCFDETMLAVYCDPEKPPILPVKKSGRRFPQHSKQDLKSRPPSPDDLQVVS